MNSLIKFIESQTDFYLTNNVLIPSRKIHLFLQMLAYSDKMLEIKSFQNCKTSLKFEIF